MVVYHNIIVTIGLLSLSLALRILDLQHSICSLS